MGRFRSKDDLHRYLTQQGKCPPSHHVVVGVFLPSLKGTSLDFMRDILREAKLHLKANEVIHLDVPHYQELSVKNMYEDAMQDEVLAPYLPSKKQLSNKLPEREFFFGVLATLRRQYMTDVIKQAHEHRYKAADDDPKKESIVVSSAWMDELTKHPYFSRKISSLIHVGKPGTGIFLLKEKAKLQREPQERVKFTLSKRLCREIAPGEEVKQDKGGAEKRMKLGNGQPGKPAERKKDEIPVSLMK